MDLHSRIDRQRRLLERTHEAIAIANRRVDHFDHALARFPVGSGGHERARRYLKAWRRRRKMLAELLAVQGAELRRLVKKLRLETYGAGGFAPTHVWRLQRVDQGQDFEIPIGQHLRAPGDGVVLGWAHDRPFPSGFGDPYAVVSFSTGPFAGLTLYLGHVNADVPTVGTHFKEGARLGRVTNWLNEGWGWAEIGLWPIGPMGNGAKIAHLFTEVHA